MNKRRWLPMLCLVAAALVACSQESPTEDNTDEPRVVQPTPEAPVITSVTEMAPSGTPILPDVNSEAGEPSEATKSYTPTPRQSGTDPFLGTVSKEELILASDTIVRASLLSATSTAATSTEPDWPGWKAVLEFRFQVHEYLKGTGPDKITAIVTESFTYNSEAEAQDLAPALLAAHDSRWDNRQAILFLSAETDDINGFSSGRLWLGYLDLPIWADSDPDDRYSLRSYRRKLWLPAASEPSSAARGQRASNDNILFMLDVPEAGASTRSTRSSAGTAPTISLADMRSLVTTLEAEASAGGTAQHRQCVELFYEEERWGRFMTKKGWLPDVYESSIESGQSAGTLIITQPEFYSDRLAELPDPITEESLLLPWIAVFEGRDPAIVDYRVHDFETYFNEGDEQDADYWEIYFSMSFETTRPLPAGEYQFFFIRDAPNPPACTKVSTYYREGNDYRLTVTPPERTLHEAFFDPVDIGDCGRGRRRQRRARARQPSRSTAPPRRSPSLKWERRRRLHDPEPHDHVARGLRHRLHRHDRHHNPEPDFRQRQHDGAHLDRARQAVERRRPAHAAASANTCRRRTVTVTITPRPEGRLHVLRPDGQLERPASVRRPLFCVRGYRHLGSFRNLGFHAASVSTVTSATGWLYDSVPDYWAIVRCDPSGGGQSRDVGRASLRAALQ